MHLVHIIIGLRNGGAEHMLKRLVLAQRLARPDWRVTVISLTEQGPVGETLADAGVDVVALGMRSPAAAPQVVLRLRRLLLELAPDLVQTWMVHADLLGGLAARWAHVPALVWGVRTTDFQHTPVSTRVVRWLCARLSSWLPHTIVCAAQASRRSHAGVGYDDRRMAVIPNGFDTDRLSASPERRRQMRRSLGMAAGDLVVGCVGRFNPAKDHANFVAAAARVAEAQPGCRFLMVGAGVDAANPALMAAIHATGHADRFMLLGERSDVPDCLDAMDVFALPSRSEGFPNVVGEAMAMGLPCVVTDVGDAALLLGTCGMVVPPRDPEALARALLVLIKMTPEDRQALGQRARDRVVQEFSIQRACEQFTRLQAGVVEDVRRRSRAH